jgi:hypothetical protein
MPSGAQGTNLAARQSSATDKALNKETTMKDSKNRYLNQDRRDANSMLNWEQGKAQGEPRASRNYKRAFWGIALQNLQKLDKAVA